MGPMRNKIGHSGRGGVLHGLSRLALANKADLVAGAPGAQFAPGADTMAQEPQYGTIPWSDQPATWWQFDYIGPLTT